MIRGFWNTIQTLRLVFPTIQENASAVSILPHFIEVCGRKIDNTANVLDWVGDICNKHAHIYVFVNHHHHLKDVSLTVYLLGRRS